MEITSMCFTLIDRLMTRSATGQISIRFYALELAATREKSMNECCKSS